MKTTIKHKIIIAHDHILLRDALANLVEGFEEFNVIAKATNGIEVIELIERGIQPDILLMDLNMPKMDGFETTRLLAGKHPQIKIVILTIYDSETVLMRLLQWGISGFLKKDIHPHELNDALLKIAAGECYYGNQTAAKIVSIFKKRTDSYLALEKIFLGDEEIEFLKLLITEMTYKEIAINTNIPMKYIHNLRKKLFKKLEVKSRNSFGYVCH